MILNLTDLTVMIALAQVLKKRKYHLRVNLNHPMLYVTFMIFFSQITCF